jgi:hypothetical protein
MDFKNTLQVTQTPKANNKIKSKTYATNPVASAAPNQAVAACPPLVVVSGSTAVVLEAVVAEVVLTVDVVVMTCFSYSKSF